MHSIFIEKPYRFVPPVVAQWPQRLLIHSGLYRQSLRKRDGVWTHEVRNSKLVKASLDAGHAVLLTPNHPRAADAGVMYNLLRELNLTAYTMASWHLFNQGLVSRWMIRAMGAFSVNREGMDRTAIDYAVNVLKTAERPLIIFPEGTTSRTNDRLMAFMDGPAFIARTAAKRRQKEGLGSGKVVIHPVAIKYLFQGDVTKAAGQVLADIENRLSWGDQSELGMVDRIVKVGDALLKVKELEYQCPTSPGDSLRQRQDNMVNHLLYPLEEEWLGQRRECGIQVRVKNLRVKIFPDMISSELDLNERKRRWRQLERTYLAQQIDCYPENYLVEAPSVDRMLETVEKFDEDFFDTCRIHGNLKSVLTVGEAIEVPTRRDKGADSDSLMTQVRERIEAMLSEMQSESRLYHGE